VPEEPGRVQRLGPSALGEELVPGRVDRCYFGILVDQPLAATAPQPGGVLVVGPAALLDPKVRQPDGRFLYDLLTGHPDRSDGDVVFLADLTVERRQWTGASWARLGVDHEGTCEAVVQRWRRGAVKGLWIDPVTAEEVRSLGRPAMTYAREELRRRLGEVIGERYMRWLHPSSRRRPGEPFL
jgi:hypothetical protein